MRVTILAAVAAAFIGSNTQAQTFDVPVDTRSFSLWQLTWGDGSGKLMWAWAGMEYQGRVALCGVYWTEGTNATSRSLALPALQQTRFGIKGKPIGLNGAHFRKVESIDAARKAKAKCRVSKAPWKKSYKPDTVAPINKSVRVMY